MKVQVKICGIRSIESALAAVSAGADFIGFNFVPSSKRYIDPKICRELINHIRNRISVVGVFQNQPIDEVNMIADMLNLDFVQLHGEEDELYIRKISRPIIKRIDGANIAQNVKTKFQLLDRKKQGKGDMVDLEKAKNLAAQFDIFFAGGLTPENVVAVIKKVKPFAVDVSGGIETNGKEDSEKIKQFIKNAKGVEI